MKHENISIPDEFTPDYSLSEEEQEKQWDEYREEGKKAFQKLQEDTYYEVMCEESCRT